MSGSVAVTRGDELLGVLSGDPAISHSNTLLGDVDKLLSQTQIALPEIDLFAVATGPGSFTGLRIGLATIKALAETLGDRAPAYRRWKQLQLRQVCLKGRWPCCRPDAGKCLRSCLMFQTRIQSKRSMNQRTFRQHASSKDMVDLENVTWCGQGAIINRELIEGAGWWPRLAYRSKHHSGASRRQTCPNQIQTTISSKTLIRYARFTCARRMLS